jgi:hypothetical protein
MMGVASLDASSSPAAAGHTVGESVAYVLCLFERVF